MSLSLMMSNSGSSVFFIHEFYRTRPAGTSQRLADLADPWRVVTRVEEKIEPVIKVGERDDAHKLAAEIGGYVVTPLIEGYIDDIGFFRAAPMLGGRLVFVPRTVARRGPFALQLAIQRRNRHVSGDGVCAPELLNRAVSAQDVRDPFARPRIARARLAGGGLDEALPRGRRHNVEDHGPIIRLVAIPRRRSAHRIGNTELVGVATLRPRGRDGVEYVREGHRRRGRGSLTWRRARVRIHVQYRVFNFQPIDPRLGALWTKCFFPARAGTR